MPNSLSRIKNIIINLAGSFPIDFHELATVPVDLIPLPRHDLIGICHPRMTLVHISCKQCCLSTLVIRFSNCEGIFNFTLVTETMVRRLALNFSSSGNVNYSSSQMDAFSSESKSRRSRRRLSVAPASISAAFAVQLSFGLTENLGKATSILVRKEEDDDKNLETRLGRSLESGLDGVCEWARKILVRELSDLIIETGKGRRGGCFPCLCWLG
ncbi:conserved hypothetical protein [Ricinus communis]|uniref:Uncharacterized protein n=1 Tax=Ricinus communis TaxID=3988 RepID=B9SXG3_RICCO|nr:conserved hypothetical protein [Ricinus communis]